MFNDCGVVIESLRLEHGLTRIAYVDIDAHRGDGVYYGFEDEPAVYTATFMRTADLSIPARVPAPR